MVLYVMHRDWELVRRVADWLEGILRAEGVEPEVNMTVVTLEELEDWGSPEGPVICLGSQLVYSSGELSADMVRGWGLWARSWPRKSDEAVARLLDMMPALERLGTASLRQVAAEMGDFWGLGGANEELLDDLEETRQREGDEEEDAASYLVCLALRHRRYLQ